MGRTKRRFNKKKDALLDEQSPPKTPRRERSRALRHEDDEAIVDSIALAEEIALEMKYSFESDPDIFLEPSDLVNFRLVGSVSLVDVDGFIVEDGVLVDFWVENEELAEKVMENLHTLGSMRR